MRPLKMMISAIMLMVAASMALPNTINATVVSTVNSTPLAVNHIAVSVPDIDTAIDFYTTILGFRVLLAPATFNRTANPNQPLFSIYTDINIMKVGWLALGTKGNSIGLEIFQFVDPPQIEDSQGSGSFSKRSFFHIGVTSNDTSALSERIVCAGGTLVGEKIETGDVKGPIFYTKDPWGNVIELLPKSFESIFGSA